MKIAIDASRTVQSQKTGVENYSIKIIQYLLAHAEKIKFTGQIFLYASNSLPAQWRNFNLHGLKIKIIPFPRLWTHIRLSAELLRDQPDVFFEPGHVLPFIHPKNCVITIHDVAFCNLKRLYPKSAYFYLNWSTRFATKYANKIIVPSQATKKDLQKFYRTFENQIEIIPHGFDNLISADKHPRKNRILFIGRIEKKKNLERLIEAFVIFSTQHPQWQLVLAGGDGFGAKEIKATAQKIAVAKKIFFPGYITEAEKIALLRSAKIFAFPSLAEGFGFPILEAFSADLPVCTADIPALREVAGDAAKFVNPYHVKEIADTLNCLANDENLRQDLIHHGHKQVEKFKWEIAAKKTWEILTTIQN